MENSFEANGKTYNNDELYQIGKLHYPKRYWIKRGVGIGLWVVGLDYGISLPFTLYYVIKFGGAAAVIGCILLLFPLLALLVAGTIVFVFSFKPEAREVYIDYGQKYLRKLEANNFRRERNLEAHNLRERAKYKKLLDRGVISQEEYDQKVETLK